MIAGLAIADAIELVTGVAVRLKWPNDVVVAQTMARGAKWPVFAGIAAWGSTDRCRWGWHQRQHFGEQMPAGMTPPTSLLVAGGQPVDRLALLAEVLTQMEKKADFAEAGHSPQPAWIKRLITIGQQSASPAITTITITGAAEACDEQGQLLVRDSGGILHTIAAGDVTPRQS